MDAIAVAIGAISVVTLFVWTSRTRLTSLPLPPGPHRLPLLGNALDIDTVKPHLTYKQWGDQYGDVVYSQLLGQDYIIVNSEKVARAMSDAQRSAVYADRPQLSMYKFLGIESSTGVMSYGDTWKMHRKLFHQTLRSEAVVKYESFLMIKAISLVRDLLRDGAASSLGSILQSFATTITLSLTYGYDIESLDHPVVKLVQGLMGIITKEGVAEKAALLQTFPFVKYIPPWFPGFGFGKRAAASRKLAKQVWEQPFEYTKGQVAASTASQSAVADFLTSQEDKDSDLYRELETVMKSAAATVYIAGAETTSSTLHTFFLAMVLFPEVQEKAQAEIDLVVGKDRLPTFGDREALPYIEAIICETMRWHPAVPIGIAHATIADDEYQGFHIPKGATIIFNTWGMSRNCVNADQFDPGRYLLPTGELSPTARAIGSPGFGFGRRACPGRFLADNMMWAALVQVLATVRLAKVRDANGQPTEVEPVFTTGVTSQPVPFQFTVSPTERAKLISR